MPIQIMPEICTGCTLCVNSCPFGAISMKNDIAFIDHDKCTLCGACVEACSFDAIVLRKHDTHKVNTEEYKGVWVAAEHKQHKIQSITYELLGAGRDLADKLDVPLTAVYFDSIENKDEIEKLYHYGADRIISVIQEGLEVFHDEKYAYLLSELSNKEKPEIILAGATSVGRGFFPRAAILLRTGLTADCTELDIDEATGNLLQTRPAFGGNIMATILCESHRPQMATVRHRVMKPIEPDTSRSGEYKKYDFGNLKDYGKEIIEEVIEFSDNERIEDADFIAAGGRGLKKPENFEMLEKLSALLGGAVGASRAAVDSGWVSYPHQIGQTGKTVNPKTYLACGISGAIQHKVGMQSSDFIIAVNTDENAPIFQIADMAITGDLFEILPILIKKLEKRLNKD